MLEIISRQKARTANTQYKTVGVQWFADVWFSNQLLPRWIQTRPRLRAYVARAR